LTVKNCIVTDFNDGVRLSISNNSQILHSNLSSNTENGIYTSKSSNITVYNSTIASNTWQGIYLYDLGEHWNVTNNLFLSNERGIYERNENCPADSANLYKGNNFTSNTAGMLIRVTDNATVTENTFTDNTYGLYFEFDYADNNTFQHNIFTGSTTNDIYFGGTFPNTMDQYFINNTVDGYEYKHCAHNSTWELHNYTIAADKITNHGAVNIYQCHGSLIKNITVTTHTTGSGYGQPTQQEVDMGLGSSTAKIQL
jgi:parallel beta-helix repeat protein